MRYAEPRDLADALSWSRLAQAAAPSNAEVTGELLQARIEGADQSALDADLVLALGSAQTRIERVLDTVSADIDSYLARRVSLPLTQTSKVLTARAVDLAAWSLVGGDRESAEHVARQTALKWLADFNAGHVDLDIEVAGETPVDAARAESDTPVMTQARMRRARF